MATIISKVTPFPGRLSYSYSSRPTISNVNRDRTSVWNAGFYKVINRVDPLGRMFHGNYELQRHDLSALPYVWGRLSYKSKGTTIQQFYEIRLSGDGYGYVIPRVRWLYEDEKSYFALINNAIKGAMEQQVNIALFLAELDKSASLLATTATRLADAASHIRHGKFSKAARTLKIRKPRGVNRSKTFADNWLAYSYGWSPLVMDMVGAMKHMHRGARGLSIKSRSRTSSSLPISDQRQVELEYEAVRQHRFLCTWRYDGNWVRNEQVSLLFRLPDAFWDQVSRLGFTNPGTLFWETIPLSFLVDWFSNTGDLLATMDLGLTLQYVTGSYVEFHRHTGTLKGTAYWADTKPAMHTYTSIQATVDSTSFEEVKLRRSVILGSDVATTWMLQPPFSVNRAITATALVAQRLR